MEDYSNYESFQIGYIPTKEYPQPGKYTTIPTSVLLEYYETNEEVSTLFEEQGYTEPNYPFHKNSLEEKIKKDFNILFRIDKVYADERGDVRIEVFNSFLGKKDDKPDIILTEDECVVVEPWIIEECESLASKDYFRTTIISNEKSISYKKITKAPNATITYLIKHQIKDMSNIYDVSGNIRAHLDSLGLFNKNLNDPYIKEAPKLSAIHDMMESEYEDSLISEEVLSKPIKQKTMLVSDEVMEQYEDIIHEHPLYNYSNTLFDIVKEDLGASGIHINNSLEDKIKTNIKKFLLNSSIKIDINKEL